MFSITPRIGTWVFSNIETPRRTSIKATPGEWTQIEVVAHGKDLEIQSGGQQVKVADLPGTPRSVISLHVLGADSEFALKDIKLELLPKNR